MTSSCHHFSAAEWEECVNNAKFCPLEELDEQTLEQLSEKRSILVSLKFNVGDAKVNFDGHTWDHSSKNSTRHKPSYKKMSINSQNVFVIQCQSFEHEFFKKEILIIGGTQFLHYFLTCNNYPSDRTAKKRRITNVESAQFREYLKKRTVSDARKLAEKDGLILSRKQASNQIKYSEDVIVGRSGPKVSYSEADIRNLDRFTGLKTTFSSDGNFLEFSAMKANENQIRMFLSVCPRKEEIKRWENHVDNILKCDLDQKRKLITELSKETSAGFKFSNRMFIDTTFNIGHLYLTQLLGETKSFRTKQSGKIRTFTLAWMLHTNKLSSTHELFAKFIRRSFRMVCDEIGDPALTCVYVDGEQSLLEYARILKTSPLRCDFHLFAQFSRKIGKSKFASQAKYVFGTMVNGYWKRGLLGSFDEEEYQKKLELIEPLLDAYLFKWLSDNKSMLLECSVVSAKLRAGHVLQFGTNNAIEANNGKLKMSVGKPRNLSGLVQSLMDYYEIREACRAASGHADTVTLSPEYSSDSMEEKKHIFKSIGLPASEMLCWNMPMKLVYASNFADLNENYEKAMKMDLLKMTPILFLLEDASVDEDSTERIVTVRKLSSVMSCSSCADSEMFCPHRIRALSEMSSSDRQAELIKITAKMFPQKATVHPKSGHKQSDRIGVRSSANNYHRNVNDISELSIFQQQNNSAEATSSLFQSTIEDIVEEQSYNDLVISNDSFNATVENGEERSEDGMGYSNVSTDLLDSLTVGSSTHVSPLANSTMLNGNIRVSDRKKKQRRSYSPAFY